MKIASRYRPFSHIPGNTCLIPNTSCEVTAYPTAVFVKDEQGRLVQIEWELTGLVKEFTLMQDLERREVFIYGIAKEGYFSYRLSCKEGSIILKLDRASQGFLKGIIKESSAEICLKPKEILSLFKTSYHSLVMNLEKISFGNHKAQDWDLIKRRNNPLEYIPFWFALGQGSAQDELPLEGKGIIKHLELCKQALQNEEKESFLEKLRELFEVGFESLLVPKLYDAKYLGLSKNSLSQTNHKTPIALLKEGYELIRKMFFEVKDNKISILCHLPSMFHAGRCLNFQLGKTTFHIEWCKKLLKKVIINSSEKQTLHFCFQKALKTFRVRGSLNTRGLEVACSEPITLDKGLYILDQFKK